MKVKIHSFAAAIFSIILSSCGGGGGSDSTNSDPGSPTSASDGKYSVEVSHSQLNVRNYLPESSRSVDDSRSIVVTYVGDELLIGYPPGVQEADWLKIDYVRDTSAPGNTINVDLSFNLADVPVGVSQKTTLRFVTGSYEEETEVHVDLPIEVQLKEGLDLFPQSIEFSSLNSSDSPPEPGVLSASAQHDAKYSVFTGNTNTAQEDWLEASALNDTIEYSVERLLPVGEYTAEKIISYTIDGFYGEEVVDVTYSVSADTPELHFVQPARIKPASKSALTIRGQGFRNVVPSSVEIEDILDPEVTVVNDTYIKVMHSGFSSSGMKEISIPNGDGDKLTIKVEPYLSVDVFEEIDAATHLDQAFGELQSYWKFDDVSDRLFFVHEHNRENREFKVAVFNRTENGWALEMTQPIPSMTFEILPNGEQALIYNSDSNIASIVSLETFNTIDTVDLNIVMPEFVFQTKDQERNTQETYSFGDGIMNSGQIQISVPYGYNNLGNSWEWTHSFLNIVNKTLIHTELFTYGIFSLSKTDPLGNKTVILNDTVGRKDQFVGVFDSLTGEFNVKIDQNSSEREFQYLSNSDYMNVCSGSTLYSFKGFLVDETSLEVIAELKNRGKERFGYFIRDLEFNTDCSIGFGFDEDDDDQLFDDHLRIHIYDAVGKTGLIEAEPKHIDFDGALIPSLLYTGETIYIAPDNSFLIKSEEGRVVLLSLDLIDEPIVQ